jgi:hypothetical protein
MYLHHFWAKYGISRAKKKVLNRILCNTNKIPKRLFVTKKILRKNYQPLVFFVYMTDKKTGNRIMLMGMLSEKSVLSLAHTLKWVKLLNAYVFVTNIFRKKSINLWAILTKIASLGRLPPINLMIHSLDQRVVRYNKVKWH